MSQMIYSLSCICVETVLLCAPLLCSYAEKRTHLVAAFRCFIQGTLFPLLCSALVDYYRIVQFGSAIGYYFLNPIPRQQICSDPQIV